MTARRRFTADIQAKVALEALRGDKARADREAEVHDLHAKACFRALPDYRPVDGGTGFFGRRAQAMSRGERKAMIARDHSEVSLSRRCRLLMISRSSYYYAAKGESPKTLALMRRIDALFMKYPFYGSRQMVRRLRREETFVGRHRVRRPMRLMGLAAIYQAPRTSTPHPAHRIYPYLLKGMTIDRPGQIWCADITYIPVQHGFLYLVAIMDWATRHALAWRLSNTMDSRFCVEALREALNRYGKLQSSTPIRACLRA